MIFEYEDLYQVRKALNINKLRSLTMGGKAVLCIRMLVGVLTT